MPESRQPGNHHAGLATMKSILMVWSMAVVALAGCNSGGSTSSGQITLDVWFHSGRQSERDTIRQQVERFHASQDEIVVELNMIPEGTYNGQVQAAALAGDLPDVLEFDGPFLYNYVWQGYLRPLDNLVAPKVIEDLLPSIVEQGTFRGDLYSVGTFDSGLGLYGRRSMLQQVGARIPSGPDDAWTVEEFDQLLKALAAVDDDGAVLDLKLNYDGEWFTYAFSPAIQSAGGDLINRQDYQSAAGILNGQASVQALTSIQSWIVDGQVDPDVDDAAFTQGRVALSWSGHWDYPRYSEAIGDDLVILPLPDFGQGTLTGQGSWCWGVTNKCEQPEAAARFVEFLLQTDEVLAMTGANGAVPGTTSGVAGSPLYRTDGPLHLFAKQLTAGHSVPRPRTPAYPVITSAFQEAFADIRNGGSVQHALDKAVATIDEDIRDNEGYPQR